MIVKGKPIADKILAELKQQIASDNLTPHLAIILAGEDPASRIYIKYKIKAAQDIGIKISVIEFAESVEQECLAAIAKMNSDPDIHGIIVQLPIYKSWNTEKFIETVTPSKDVDGFTQDGDFTPATAEGAWEILSEFARLDGYDNVRKFLDDKPEITILGRGKTAGQPIINLIGELGYPLNLINSKTENPNEIIKRSDIIISAVGKPHLINANNIKEGCYIVSIGVSKGADGKMVGDVDEESIKDKARMFCPTIGGVGPLTIACLLRNVTNSAQSMRESKIKG